MIAQDGDRTCTGAKVAELVGDRFRRDECSANDSLDDEIAQDADHVRRGGIGPIDDFPKLSQMVEWGPDVKVSQHRDAKRTGRGPRNCQRAFVGPEACRLEPDTPQAKRENCCGPTKNDSPGR